MTTKVLATSIVADGDSSAVPVQAGQYMIAVGGSFGGGTVQLKANIGPVVGAVITGAAYTVASAEVVWLPDCTAYVSMTGSTTPDVAVALAELSTKLND